MPPSLSNISGKPARGPKKYRLLSLIGGTVIVGTGALVAASFFYDKKQPSPTESQTATVPAYVVANALVQDAPFGSIKGHLKCGDTVLTVHDITRSPQDIGNWTEIVGPNREADQWIYSSRLTLKQPRCGG